MILRQFLLLLFVLQVTFISGKSYDAFNIAQWEDLNDRAVFKKVEHTKPILLDALDSSDFEPLNGSTINLGFYYGGVWVKFDLNPNEGELMVLGNPILDYGKLFKQSGDSIVELEELGDLLPFSGRSFKSRKPVFRFPSVEQKTTFYLFVSNQGEQFYLPILLWSKKDFAQFDKLESYFFGAYLGVLFFVLIFNAFIAVGLKERNIFNYIFYLIGLILLQLALSGYGLKWIYGDYPGFAARSTPLFSSVSILFLLSFARAFLAIKSYFPGVDKVLSYAQVFLIFNIILSCILPNGFLIVPIVAINLLTFVFGVAIIPIAYKIYKAGYQPARYFLLAFISLIVCVFLFVLRNLGLIENNFISENGLIIGSSLEVVLITFAIVDKFKTFRDQSIARLEEINKIRSDVNKLLEKKVKERTEELEFQTGLVLTKNKEITDSINYAKRIQTAVLPSIDKLLLGVKDAFVLYRPKDIVSGDFYWVSHMDNKSVYVVADCTGHGVPGAFMSMIGSALLNQIVNEKKILHTDLILHNLREGVIEALSQNKYEGVTQKDGMDLSIVVIDHSSKKVEFSGANNSLYLVRQHSGDELGLEFVKREEAANKSIYELRPDKQPIGVYSDELKPFTRNEFQLIEGDIIYMFTDGFPDQFGGERGKKLKYKNFRRTLLNYSDYKGSEQKNQLGNFYINWMEQSPMDNFQVDDVCVLGLFY